MTDRPLREPLEEMVDELARRQSEPPPSAFRAPSGVVRQALEERVGLEVSEDQLEDALTARAGRRPSGEWRVQRLENGAVLFRRSG